MTDLRAIPPELSPEAVGRVDARLDGIVREHGVHIPLAVESGSRAWGFPSPDSDYDGRFLFVRPEDQHLTLWPRRDVIETPIEGELDVGGWELGKALKLLLKGNAVVVEWLTSPIVYRGTGWFRDELLGFAGRAAERGRIAAHYRHLGLRQRGLYAETRTAPALKRVFYALRPAAALRWLRLHPERAVAPMHLPTLMAECAPPAEVAALTAELIARKAVTRELGSGEVPAALLAFIDAELEAGAELQRPADPARRAVFGAEAEALYRGATRRLDLEAG